MILAAHPVEVRIKIESRLDAAFDASDENTGVIGIVRIIIGLVIDLFRIVRLVQIVRWNPVEKPRSSRLAAAAAAAGVTQLGEGVGVDRGREGGGGADRGKSTEKLSFGTKSGTIKDIDNGVKHGAV